MYSSDYNFSDRLLHHLALGVPFIRKASFDIDGIINVDDNSYLNDKHVFVCGLARSGTTVLMRELYDSSEFRSLTYRDMPFVLMPGVWRKISASFHKQQTPKERAHGDGILVDFDSPEAFEEVFWQTFSGKEYIFDDHLAAHNASDEHIELFREYVGRIINSSQTTKRKRYLSKNNNNIVRLNSIRKAFPNSIIIIPFRDPLQHAISLLHQHKKFCKRHSKDKFAYNYMRWLGHYEFGLTHKRFMFDDFSSVNNNYEADDINYWLTIWLNTYSYLINHTSFDCMFLCFEALCEFPVKTLKPLFESADLVLDKDKINKAFHAPLTKNIGGIDKSLMYEAQIIYQDMKE